MKRTATALALAFAAAALLTGASVWEGAAVTAAAGELPDSGFYVATNAFPRNTVVDVKNLENDQTVRAIVSGGLDSPGLLASLSRDAASAIDMSLRDIGRVRITMPADPIAFSRFNEGFEPSGDPDHDPKAAIAAATVPGEELPAASPPVAAALPVDAAETPAAVTQEETPVDMEEVAEAGPEIQEETAPVDEVPEDAALAEAAPEDGTLAAEPPAVAAVPVPQEAEPEAAEAGPSETPVAAAPEAVSEVGGEETQAPVPEADEIAEANAPVPVPEGESVEVVLVPAEERPPEAAEEGSLPAEAEVAPLPEADASIVAEPVPTLPGTSVAAPLETQPVRAEPRFGAPVITGLEKGKYYLQLGAFGKTEAVEAEIAKHGKSYPLAIQNSGSDEEPVYRVLVGPVNLGESGALLQRFKRSGYKDAFVKQGS